MRVPAMLAQAFEVIDAPTPTPLASGPLWSRFLLENPYPAVILLLIGAFAAWRLLNNALKGREANIAAAACVALALAIFALARFVQTDRERLRDLTRELVRSTATADVTSLEQLLSPQLSLFRPGGGLSMGKEETLERVQNELGKRYRVREWAVLETQASTDSPTSGITQTRVRVTLEMSPFPTISWWKIDWRKDANGVWRADRIDPVSVPQAVRSALD